MSETKEIAKRGIGDNHPPGPVLDNIDPRKLIDVSVVVPVLKLNYKALIERVEEAKLGVAAWIGAHSETPTSTPHITNDEDCGDTQDMIKQLREICTQEIEPARKAVVAPLDKSRKAIQGFFNETLVADLDKAMRPMQDAYHTYQTAKLNREREARRLAAFNAQQEALRIADQARRAREQTQQDTLLEKAAEAEQRAESLAAAVNVSARELTRVHGELGSVGGLKEVWSWDVEEMFDLITAVAQGQQPIAMLIPNPAYIDKLVKKEDGVRKIPGLRIFSELKAR